MEIWAEAGQCEGDIEYAFKAVDEVSAAGADVLKVQVLRPELIATPDATMYDYLHTEGTQRANFAANLGFDAWKRVAERCTQRGIEFLPSVFDEEAAIEMAKVAQRLKIASGDITNRPLIESAAQEADSELVISTGGATALEIEQAVGWASAARRGIRLTILACHLQYPTSHLGDANLGRILAIGGLIQQRGWDAGVGYSDHTEGTATTPLLTAMGVSAQEKHFTLLGKGHGRDHEFAVGPEELKAMCDARIGVINMFGNIDLTPTIWETPALERARRSIWVTADIPKGQRITRENTAPLRPFNDEAVTPADWEALMHRRIVATVDIPAGEPLLKRAVGNAGGTLTVE